MNQKGMEPDERAFEIELNPGGHLKKVNVPNGAGGLLMEGTLGSLEKAMFVEDSVLELVGTAGTLRVDLSMEDLKHGSGRESGA